MGNLQVWVASPILGGDVYMPRDVRPIVRDLRFSQLAYRPLMRDLGVIVVDNGEHDIEQVMADLQAWAAEPRFNR
jgi:hypothetical protein